MKNVLRFHSRIHGYKRNLSNYHGVILIVIIYTCCNIDCYYFYLLTGYIYIQIFINHEMLSSTLTYNIRRQSDFIQFKIITLNVQKKKKLNYFKLYKNKVIDNCIILLIIHMNAMFQKIFYQEKIKSVKYAEHKNMFQEEIITKININNVIFKIYLTLKMTKNQNAFSQAFDAFYF